MTIEKRLKKLINQVAIKKYPQCFAVRTETSSKICGLGFDRWHFILDGKNPLHLVSVWHFNQFIYVNYKEFPCKIVSSLDEAELFILTKFLNKGPDMSWVGSTKELSAREAQIGKVQGIIDSTIKGKNTPMINIDGKDFRERMKML